MSFPLETGGNEGFDGGGDTGGAPENSGGGNGAHPAWNDMLGVIPQELHEQVLPHLRNWDQNVQKVQQQFAPYREFSQGGWTPDRLRQAVGVAQAIEQNPRGFMDVLRRHFGDDEAEEMVQSGPQGNDWQGQLPPEMAQQLQALQERQEVIAQVIMNDRQTQADAQEDRELQSFYDYVSQTNPTYKALNEQANGLAERIVNGFLSQGMTGQQAVDSFMQFVQHTGAFHNRPKPPPVMGSGGGGLIGSNQKTQVAKLSGSETKNLVAEILRGATASNQ